MTAETNGGASASGTFAGLLRAGFPYEKTIGMHTSSWYPIDIALGGEGRVYCLRRGAVRGGRRDPRHQLGRRGAWMDQSP